MSRNSLSGAGPCQRAQSSPGRTGPFALWFGLRSRLSPLGFYLVFALAVTVSVQLVGVYLVFATLIVPSLGARQHPPARRLPLAYAIGILGYASGLALSAALDLPSGALIVWCLALLAVAVHAMAPRTSATAEAGAVADRTHAAI